jgi:hypothetical protein
MLMLAEVLTIGRKYMFEGTILWSRLWMSIRYANKDDDEDNYESSEN